MMRRFLPGLLFAVAVSIFGSVPTLGSANAAQAILNTEVAPAKWKAVRLKNLKHQRDSRPLDAACDCPCCTQFSRAYLRHLFMTGEMLGPVLVSWHNIAFYQQLLRGMREAIERGSAAEYRARQLASWAG